MYQIKSNNTSDIAEQMVKLDLIQRGWVVLDPSSRDLPYDFVVEKKARVFETVQVKKLNGKSFSTTNRGSAKGNETTTINGNVRYCYSYADEKIDWMVAVDVDYPRIYYYPLHVYMNHTTINVSKVPSVEFGYNRQMVNKRMRCEQNSLI